MRLFTALLVLATAAPAMADVSHYGPVAKRYAETGDAFFEKKQYVRALDDYLRELNYDSTYGMAVHSALRMAQILDQGSRAKVSCLTPLRRDDAVLLLRYVEGTAKPGQEHLGDVDPATEGRLLYSKITGAAHMKEAPLSNVMGERRGPDKKLDSLEKIAARLVAACHPKLGSMRAGRFERELAVVRAEWKEDANAALEKILPAKGDLDAAQAEELFRGACADWHSRYQPPLPCDLLKKGWPLLGKVLGDRLSPYLSDIDPGLREAAAFFASASGSLGPAQVAAVRGQFFRKLDADQPEAKDDELATFAGFAFADNRGPFEEQQRAWLDKAKAESNPYRQVQQLASSFRALYAMGEPGREYVRAKAKDAAAAPLLRATAAEALLRSKNLGEIPLLQELAQSGSPEVQERLAYALRDAEDPKMIPALDPIFERGVPEATYRAIQAIEHLSAPDEQGAWRAYIAARCKAARTALLRPDLGGVAEYTQQDSLEIIRGCDDAETMRVVLAFKTDNLRLLLKQLEYLAVRAEGDPSGAEAFAKARAAHQNAEIRAAARRVVNSVKDVRERGH